MKKDPKIFIRHILESMDEIENIEMNTVWETAKKDLPKLKTQISKILRSL